MQWKAVRLSLSQIQNTSLFKVVMNMRVKKSTKSVTLTWFLSQRPEMKITRLPAK